MLENLSGLISICTIYRHIISIYLGYVKLNSREAYLTAQALGCLATIAPPATLW